jgi:general stress protein YciG
MDENEKNEELELAKQAAKAFGRLGGHAKAAIPGEMSRMGRRGGSKRASIPGEMRKLGKLGGLARAVALTPERRSEIAKIAVTAREAKRAAKMKNDAV